MRAAVRRNQPLQHKIETRPRFDLAGQQSLSYRIRLLDRRASPSSVIAWLAVIGEPNLLTPLCAGTGDNTLVPVHYTQAEDVDVFDLDID